MKNFGMKSESFIPIVMKVYQTDTRAEKMLLEFAESGHPVFRATSPLSRGRVKSKGHVPTKKRLRLFFALVSVNQLSLYGAVAEMCEGQSDMGGQSSSSLVLSVIKTEVLLDCDDRAHKDFLLQQHGGRIESYHDKTN